MLPPVENIEDINIKQSIPMLVIHGMLISYILLLPTGRRALCSAIYSKFNLYSKKIFKFGTFNVPFWFDLQQRQKYAENIQKLCSHSSRAIVRQLSVCLFPYYSKTYTSIKPKFSRQISHKVYMVSDILTLRQS